MAKLNWGPDKLNPRPVEQVVADAEIELDQTMAMALEVAWQTAPGMLTDDELFVALSRLNTPGLRRFIREPEKFAVAFKSGRIREKPGAKPSVAPILQEILSRAAMPLASSDTLSTARFIAALIDETFATDREWSKRPVTIDKIGKFFKEKYHGVPIAKMPETADYVRSLKSSFGTPSDFQYLVALQGGRLSFRVATVLDDYVQASDSGLLVPQRALLTHLGDLGLFSNDAIMELEELLNSTRASEADYQKFFEQHPGFFRKWDYREVHPHVYLSREDDADLIPDFILTNKDTQEAAIVELKLPNPRHGLVRRQRSRHRFTDAVMEARAQLLEYQAWFEESRNRAMLKSRLGMDIYRPRIMAIVGRSSDFADALDRQRLRARTPDIEIVTFDDMLAFANRRRVTLK